MSASSWWSDLINKWFPTPIVTSFEADPQIIIAGGTSLLSWKTDKAKSVSISPSVGSVDEDGNSVVAPIVTTKYTLIASGILGIKKVTQDLTVAVGGKSEYEATFDHKESRANWKCCSLFNSSLGLFTGLLDDVSRQNIEIWRNNSRIYSGNQESTAQPCELNGAVYFPTESDGDLRGLRFKNNAITEVGKLRHSGASIVYKGQPCFISSEDRGEMFINAETGADVLKLAVGVKVGIPFAACHLPLSQEVIVVLADNEGNETLVTTDGIVIPFPGAIAVENWNGKIVAAAGGWIYYIDIATKTPTKFTNTGSTYVNQLYYDMLNDILWCSCSGPDKLIYFDADGTMHKVIELPGTTGKMFATRVTDGWWCGGTTANWYKITKKGGPTTTLAPTTPAPTTPAPTTNVPPIIVKNGELWVGDLNINDFGSHQYPPARPLRPAKPNEVHGEVTLKSIDSKNRYNIRGYIAEVMGLETRGTTPGSGTVQVMDNGGFPTKWYVI